MAFKPSITENLIIFKQLINKYNFSAHV